VIRERGPITVAAFMDLALYHPELGYYARAAQRSGRAGDFFTSVDVGPIFGELVEVQLAEMSRVLDSKFQSPNSFDLVEAGAGNGRLSADILRAAKESHPAFYESIHLHLVEASADARAAQRATLGDMAGRLTSSRDTLPDSFEGVLIANELLDALPAHQVVMREDGLKEVFVDVHSSVFSRQSAVFSRQSAVVSRQAAGSRPSDVGGRPSAMELPTDDCRLPTDDCRLTTDDCRLTTVEAPPSTPALQAYLDRLGIALEPGWRVEINLAAVDWIRDAARRLTRGFIILIDYGHEARELYSATHAAGTLTTFAHHQSSGPESSAAVPSWLQRPGEQDITAHVDFTSVRTAAEAEGMATIAFLDQTYFLLGLLPHIRNPQSVARNLKTLVMPGGLGSTHKVLILGKGVGAPALQGCSFKVRVT